MGAPRINHMAIVACVVFQGVFAMFFYSPWLFGEMWFSLAHLSPDDLDALGVEPQVIGLLACFIATYALAWLIIATQSFNPKGGLKIALIICLGFFLPAILIVNSYKGYSLLLSALESISLLVAFGITGPVLAGWRRRS